MMINTKKLLITVSVVSALIGLSGCNSSSKNLQKQWSHSELINLTATQAANEIKSGNLTSTELTSALLEQAEKHFDLNIFITLDREGALSRAAEIDALYSAGQTDGALFGVPVALKDNIHAAGMKNTAGTPALANFMPSVNAPTVQSLLDAGAVVIGKTNMHELAFGITSDNTEYGRVGNPYKPTHTAGGSSGGSGAALAARMVPLALGTDTGGSVRIPASLNGVFSLRPTMGRYSQEGTTPISHTRDTVGPMARSIEDLVLADALMSSDTTEVIAADITSLRIGVPRSYFYDNLDSETGRIVETTLQNLRDAGVTLVEVDLSGVAELNGKIGFPVVLYETVGDLTNYLAGNSTGLSFEQLAAQTNSPDVSGLFAILSSVDENNDGIPDGRIPEAVYQDAIQVHRPALRALFANYYQNNNLDAMLIPTTPLPARVTEGLLTGVELNGSIEDTFGTYIRNTDPDSNAGLPGVAFPVGLTADGLPVGMQLGGPEGSDKELLSIALSLTQYIEELPAPVMD